jgi:mono/diheme cytochrome c family protein
MRIVRASLMIAALAGAANGGAGSPAKPPAATFRQYCFQCHGKTATAGINLEQLTSRQSFGGSFQQWQKVVSALEEKRMPPPQMPQPAEAERRHAAAWIRTKLDEFINRHAGDPGRVTVRRLTSAEYAYTIRDLTGLDLKMEGDFATDAVGGEGFANFGDVQFMQDANLERYLQTAKKIASHAVVGAGPLEFFEDPGKSGLELSAISRIQRIYRAHGFRAASGEGGKPYGLERYAKAFYAAWRYRHRKLLHDRRSLYEIAAREGLSPRFIDHIWTVLEQPSPSYPISDVVSRWRLLPPPDPGRRDGTDSLDKTVRAQCDEIQKFLIDWPRWLFGAGGAAEGGQGDERALVLSDAEVKAAATHRFRAAFRSRGRKTSRVYLFSMSMNPVAREKSTVVWRNGSVRFRRADRSAGPAQPLAASLDEASRKRLGLAGGDAPNEFAMSGDASLYFDIAMPEGAAGLELQIDVELGPHRTGDVDDAVVRCTISEREELATGRPVSALLAHPQSAGFKAWKAGVLEFAERLPQISHREPTPSDRDPIPAPFDNTYNQPERDRFHTQLKYYRDDRFLVEKMLDDATRSKLEHAWADLLTSFEYHDAFLRFIAEKYRLDMKHHGIAALEPDAIEKLPEEPRTYVKVLRAGFEAAEGARQAAYPGHVEDCIRFAAQAWRRPLSAAEKDMLRSFYVNAREGARLDHPTAIRSLLARILVAPAFLYRLEQSTQTGAAKALSDWEVASRLSYFLWSSMPDEELRRAAESGALRTPEQIARQVKRMLSDARVRRLSTEFFGQWLGFYRFEQHNGVDTSRFPEFSEEVKAGMYDEAVSFFEHIVRKDRPLREILSADYTFLNRALAKHYGAGKEIASPSGTEFVEGANGFHRGGLLRLGAVLTVTSAPLRTSPVKRGDWVLRRVLGEATPPPPADAGSIPADDKLFAGLTIQERLAEHQRNPSCASCHSRIDPLGFSLERYDSLGRWRDRYADGKPVHDAGVLADQTEIAGVDGLLRYLKTREPQVVRTLASKLLGYALGRTVLASDLPLIDRLAKMGGDVTFAALATEIAASRQFRYRMNKEEAP